MKKMIFLILLGSLYASGMSYEAFKSRVLKQSKILKSKAINGKITQTQNAIALRASNPSVDIEAARYRPRGSSDTFGYAVTLSQPIRTESFMDAVTTQSEATRRLSEALIAENRALFLQNLERFYTDYVYLGKLQTLLEKEYRLARKTASIARQRYESGAEDKIAYLRAKNRALAIKSQITSLGEEISQRYFTLLTLAGTQKKIRFQKRFIYPLRMPKSQPKKRTPKEAILEAQTKAAEAKLKRSNVLIERYNLYGGIEKEPDQSILRIGLSIPLPLVHQKAEEKQLARLQKEQSQLQLQQYKMERNNTIRSLRASLGALIDAYRENSTLARQQRKLTALLQEGYRLSGARLFDLLMEQQKLIQTEKKRLELQKKINQQQITLRYFEGKYND